MSESNETFVSILTYKRELYKNSILSAIMPKTGKILNLSDSRRRRSQVEMCAIDYQPWPVRAREVPTLSSPTIVLDIPDLQPTTGNIVDWGKTGYLASLYKAEVYLWKPETNVNPFGASDSDVTLGNCIKWNKDGTAFALSLRNHINLALWDVERNKIIYKGTCTCLSCRINCIEWSMDGRFILTGCSRGRLCVFSESFRYIKDFYPSHIGEILTIRFSSQGNYFISTGFDGFVKVWKWPIEECIVADIGAPVKAVAWHPWRENLFVISPLDEAKMMLFSVSSVKLLDTFSRPYKCDALTFSEVTGELVASFYTGEEDQEGHNVIGVLSSLDVAVDSIEFHMGRVPYLLWSPDGSQLATCGSDDNLCLWNFLGGKKRRPRSRKKSGDYNFGICIR